MTTTSLATPTITTTSLATPAITVTAVAATAIASPVASTTAGAAPIAAATRSTIITVATWASITIAPTTLVSVALGAGFEDRLEITLNRQQLDERRGRLVAGLDDTEHRDAVDLLLDLDLEFVTDLGIGRKD